jgi:hypothetical protein
MRVYAVALHEGLRLKCSRLRPKSGLYHVLCVNVIIKNDDLEMCGFEVIRRDFCTKIRVADGVPMSSRNGKVLGTPSRTVFFNAREMRARRCSRAGQREGKRVSKTLRGRGRVTDPPLQNRVLYKKSFARDALSRQETSGENRSHHINPTRWVGANRSVHPSAQPCRCLPHEIRFCGLETIKKPAVNAGFSSDRIQNL